MTTSQTSTKSTAQQRRQHRELQLFAAGVAVWLLLGTGLLLLALASPAQARAVLSGLFAELAAGREAGIPVALAAGASPWFVWPTSVLQDLGTALVSYPIFLYLLHRYRDSDRYLMRRLRALQKKAAANRPFVRRWGPLGLGLFMLIPFLVNGPFVALIMGRLAGIRTGLMLGPVVVATVITAGMWTFFFDALISLLDAVHPQIGWIVAGVAVSVVAALALTDFLRERSRSAA